MTDNGSWDGEIRTFLDFSLHILLGTCYIYLIEKIRRQMDSEAINMLHKPDFRKSVIFHYYIFTTLESECIILLLCVCTSGCLLWTTIYYEYLKCVTKNTRHGILGRRWKRDFSPARDSISLGLLPYIRALIIKYINLNLETGEQQVPPQEADIGELPWSPQWNPSLNHSQHIDSKSVMERSKQETCGK